jgi:hypothetical protein
MARPSKKKPNRHASVSRPSTLDARALEAVERFVHVLGRCGCAPEDVAAEVLRLGRKVPKSWAQKAKTALRELDDASHVLTLWFSDPAFLDSNGNPKPLSLAGPRGSIEALAHRVGERLEARSLVRYLALRRRGARYVPRDRVVSLRGAGGPDYFRRLRCLAGFLRTLEHNDLPERRVPGRFEFFAENPNFPVSARPAFDKRLRVRGMRFLMQMDGDMLRHERARRKGEPTVRVGVGVYRFEDDAEPVKPPR